MPKIPPFNCKINLDDILPFSEFRIGDLIILIDNPGNTAVDDADTVTFLCCTSKNLSSTGYDAYFPTSDAILMDKKLPIAFFEKIVDINTYGNDVHIVAACLCCEYIREYYSSTDSDYLLFANKYCTTLAI
jgi:hypothetical protein